MKTRSYTNRIDAVGLALPALREAVATLLPTLTWRWHGIGLLQAYIRESTTGMETRVHIWSKDLMLDGITGSGNAHNHRFRLVSTVLVGNIQHKELILSEDEEGRWETWTFPPARQHTEENRGLMVRDGKRYDIRPLPYMFTAGQTYEFETGGFHTSIPRSPIVVTIVQKHEQENIQARVLAPVDSPPVPAFGYTAEQREALDIKSWVLKAQRALRGENK